MYVPLLRVEVAARRCTPPPGQCSQTTTNAGPSDHLSTERKHSRRERALSNRLKRTEANQKWQSFHCGTTLTRDSMQSVENLTRI